MDISNKHVLITGGSSGIGLFLAKELREQGAKITILDESKSEDIEVGDFIECDISQEHEVSNFLGNLPTVDVLVNNAAIAYDNLLVSFSE